MIKFFRHIRKTLISENKMGKYFKYAIGEILLVVIGILIALQINNWNERQKEIKQEQIYLKNLQNDFNTIITAYNVANDVEDLIIKQSDDILKHFEANDGFYNMDTIFPKINDLTVRWGVTANSTTLIEMINSGQTKLIRNESLKKELIAFNEELELWSTNTLNNNTNLVDNLIVPEIFKLGTYSTHGYSTSMKEIFETYTATKLISINNNSLDDTSLKQLNRPEIRLNLINLINYRHSIATLQKGTNNNTLKRVEQLLGIIASELKVEE